MTGLGKRALAGTLAALIIAVVPAFTPSALADPGNGAVVSTYGQCVANGGIDPSTHVAAPMTVVANANGVQVGLPHQNVDGNPPPSVEGGGWSACGM